MLYIYILIYIYIYIIFYLYIYNIAGEIATHKFIKILFCYCHLTAWWRSSDNKIYYETYKKDLSNIV